MEELPLVTIRCTVYNHEPYLRQCLDGFVMQKTNFKFEAWVHDDASTDGSAEIIREYAKKYPEIIKPYYEKENLYSKHDQSFREVTWNPKYLRGKYIALCEGDDYWIDPYKLQKQVDILEKNIKITMVCCKSLLFSQEKQLIVGENRCYSKSQFMSPVDIITKAGLYISTCSIVYRSWIVKDYPDYCTYCHVGDYPLQMMCAMKGKVYYIDEPMAVYRIENKSSWCGKQTVKLSEESLKGIASEVRMLNGFSEDFPKYRKYFLGIKSAYINSHVPDYNDKNYKNYLNIFAEDISQYSLCWKIDFKMTRVKSRILSHIYAFFSYHLFKYKYMYNYIRYECDALYY